MTLRPTPPFSEFAHTLELLLRLQGKAMAAIARERHPDQRDTFMRDLAQRLEAELLRSGWRITKGEGPASGASDHAGVKE